MVLVDSGASSPQLTTNIAKTITNRFLIAVVTKVLDVFEYFIDVCDDDEVRRREILQSERDFITKRRKHGLTLHAC